MPELDLVVAGTLDVTRHREDARAGGAVDAHGRVPLAAVLDDVRHRRDRLDVVHDRGRGVETLRGRERRLDARHRALALEAREQPGLVAGDVAAGTTVQHHFEVEAGTADVLADVAVRVRVGERRREPLGAECELTAQVDERVVGAGSRTR